VEQEPGTSDWFHNDGLFFAELEEGHRYTVEVGRRLRSLGIAVDIPALSKRETIKDRHLYHNEHDIVIPGSPQFIIEVKSRKRDFNCAHDFPHETVFVDTVSGWDRKDPKPIAVVYISQITMGIAVIRGSTRRSWKIEEAFDPTRNITDHFYSVPRNLLVGFGDLVKFLEKQGRVVSRPPKE